MYEWQHAAWQRLEQASLEDRFPHALLLANAPGVGQLAFAQTLAAALLCGAQEKNGLARACGKCSACHLHQQGHHPDFFYLAPEENSRVIKIESVRAVQSNSYTTSFGGRYKVVLVAPAHALNPAAAAALLKTLEEPTTASVWILTTEHVEQLPITLRSRCQRVSWAVPDDLIQDEQSALLNTCIDAWRRCRDPLQLSTEWQKLSFPSIVEVLLLWCEEMIRVLSSIPARAGTLSTLSQMIKKPASLPAWFEWRNELLKARLSGAESFSLNTGLWLDALCCQLWELSGR